MRTLSKLAAATSGAALLALTATGLAQAQQPAPAPAPATPPAQTEPSEQAKEARERARQLQEEARKRAEEVRNKAEDRSGKKLEDTKLRVCKNRENGINRLMGRMGERGQRQLDLFTKVSDRVQNYAEDKDLTVSGYAALLAEVTAKKTAAQAAVDAVKAARSDFKCDGTDPKGAAAVFKQKVTAQNEALKAYRAAVINLLKAVKQAQGATSPAPAPAPSPATPPASPATNSGEDQ